MGYYLEPLCSSSCVVVAAAVGDSLQMYHTDAFHNPETHCFEMLRHNRLHTYYRRPWFFRRIDWIAVFLFYMLFDLLVSASNFAIKSHTSL